MLRDDGGFGHFEDPNQIRSRDSRANSLTRTSGPLGLFDLFRHSVEQYPLNVALDFGDETLTYEALSEEVDGLARWITEPLDSPPRRVGLHMPRSRNAYISYLAALRLGAAVVPLRPSGTNALNARLIAQAGLDVVLSDRAREVSPMFGDVGARVFDLSRGWADSGRDLDEARPGPEDVAYILFTSGSTGTPKGVPITHANVVPYIRWAIERYQVGGSSRLSQNFDLSFDPSVFDLFVAWGAGAAVVAPRNKESLLPNVYATQRCLTHWFCVPSLGNVARRLGALSPGAMPDLGWSLFIGEAMPFTLAEAWHSAAPNSVIENVYGPTEATISCTYYRLPSERSEWPTTENHVVPIGRPNPGIEHVIVDDSGHLGDRGELCVRGQQRFGGYLGRDDNADRFISVSGGRCFVSSEVSPPEAALYYRTGDLVLETREYGLAFLGRVDHQVKLRGYRIELSAVEAILSQHPDVDEVVAVVHAGAGEEQLWVAYIGSDAVTADQLRECLSSHLEASVLPQRCVQVANWPTNVAGKIDRHRLLEIMAHHPDGDEVNTVGRTRTS